jgi:hypothetical protein
MPALPISQLPASAALTGVELLPAVQDGATVRATVTQLRAGLAETAHAHPLADVSGLPAALASKRAVGRRSLWLPAAALNAPASGGAVAGSTDGPSHGVVLRTLDFAADAVTTAQALIALPKGWNRGSVTVQPLWTTSGGAGSVVWSVGGAALGDGDGLDSAVGAPVTLTDALTTAGALHAAPESPAITLAGTPTADGLTLLTIARATEDPADTLDAPALLLGLRVFYRVDAASDD